MESPQVIAQRWASMLGQAGPKFRAGVQAVVESPTAKAADKSDKYISGVQRAVSTGRYQSGLRRISLESWKTAMITKGEPRLDSGARAAIPKMTAFLSEFLPALESITASVNSMPNDTREQRIAKSAELQRRLGEWGDRRSGTV